MFKPFNMDFPHKIPSIPTFPIKCPPKGAKYTRNHGYLLAQSLFQTELPGEDMVRHANQFLEKDLSEIIMEEQIKATSINSQNNRVYTINFTKVYVSPPFYINSNKEHEQADLLTCKKLRVSYNLGIWVDIEFKVRTYTVIPPLRNFRRRETSTCFFAPCLFLEATSTDPSTSTKGFVCRRTIKDGWKHVYDTRLEVRFAPHVLEAFHEDGKNRQNNNSANLVDRATYTQQLWSNTKAQAFDHKVWACRKVSSGFHMLVKNVVMIGEYDVDHDVFTVKHMGKKSILRGKTVHTKPPYIEQHKSLFEHETVDTIPNVLLLQLPCMVGSSICHTRRDTRKPFRYDSSVMHAGTCERVVMRNIDFRTDVCYVKALDNDVYEGVLRSTHDIRNARRSTSATSVFVSSQGIYLVLPFLTTKLDHNLKIHIVEFIKLMIDEPRTEDGDVPSLCDSIQSFMDILSLKWFHGQCDRDYVEAFQRMFRPTDQLVALLKESRHQVLLRLGQLGSRQASKVRQMKAIQHTLHAECLPHLGISGTVESRRFKLMHVIKDILFPTMDVFLKKKPPTNIYSLRSKRVNGYADIVGIMFQQSLVRFRKTQLNMIYEKTRGNVVIDASIIHGMFDHQRKLENIIYYGFNTGNVQPNQMKGNKSKNEKKKQVAIETILAVNPEGKTGNIRRFHVAYAKKNYSQAQRLLHPSQWHFVCPAEVPEGERCGLVMNFCLGVRTSVGYMTLHQALRSCFLALEMAPGCKIASTLEEAVQLFSKRHDTTSFLHINHVVVGQLNPSMLVDLLKALKQARTMGMFHYEVSIYGKDNDIHLETNKGRLLRPVLNAAFLDNQIFDRIFQECVTSHLPLWKTMEQKHVIEFVSCHEIEDDIDHMVIATNFDAYHAKPGMYTHVEIDDLFMYSNMAANSTLQGHNACVRTSYACKHRSQAASGQPLYADTAPENTKLSLDYCQTPLVESVTNRMTHHTMQIHLSTECIFGLINDETTCEDGVIVSKSFLERGGMRVTKTQDFHAQQKAHHYIRVPPPNTIGIKTANYNKLDANTGLVKKGTMVQFNDVLAGIVMEDTKTHVFCDKSIIYSKKIPGKVVAVESMKTKYGIASYTITVQLLGVSQVQVGDKLASPYSQKGVVVAIVPQEDMPTVAFGPCMGMPLDLSFNCHSVPTRMTGATTDAPLYGMYACKFGKRVNGTAFQKMPDESREGFIQRVGGDGKVWMRNPKTGTLFPEKIFVGCASYMRLNHLVAEKAHARNGGPVDAYRQPKAGKAKNGGLRMGKMERLATEGHGAAEFTYERMFLMSDRSVAYVCENCSSINGEPPSKGQSKGLCRLCNDPQSCRPVEMPYSTIVLLNYMKASGMPIHLKLEPDEDNVDIQEVESEDEWSSDGGFEEEDEFF